MSKCIERIEGHSLVEVVIEACMHTYALSTEIL